MNREKIKWNLADSKAAIKQGWDLFDAGERFEICKIDDVTEHDCENEFQTDDEAVAFVIYAALSGDQRAVRALIHTWIMDPVTSAKVMSNAAEHFVPCGWGDKFHGLFSAVPWERESPKSTRDLAEERSQRIRDDRSIFPKG